jgi:hypothetical protein
MYLGRQPEADGKHNGGMCGRVSHCENSCCHAALAARSNSTMVRVPPSTVMKRARRPLADVFTAMLQR